MIKIITIALQLVFVAAGAAAGLWLKAAPASQEASDESSVDNNEESPATAKNTSNAHKKPAGKAAKKDGHGKKAHSDTDSDSAYGFIKFSRQFIVPILDKSGVNSLVILDINIEVPPDLTESIYLREPRLRDAILSKLLLRSNEGAFEQDFLSPSNLDSLRTDLLNAAQSVIGDDAKNILILNITRQHV